MSSPNRLRIRRRSVTVAVLLLAAGPAPALEVYRIGGEGLPPPQGAGVRFHQLSWSAAVEQDGLDPLALGRGTLRPIFIDPGVNVAASSLALGGGPYVRVSGVASYSITAESRTMLDADTGTGYVWQATAAPEHFAAASFVQTHRITLDLGGEFPVSRVRMIPLASGQYPDKLQIATSLSLQGKDSRSGYGGAVLSGEKVYDLLENTADTIDVSFKQTLARTVDLLLTRISSKSVTVAEIEVFGEGFIRSASYTGPLIDLGQPAVWGDIRWGGKRDPRGLVHIQTRSGNDLDANVYWRFTGRGSELTRLEADGSALDAIAYKLLKPGEAAGITYDTENWSFWSAPYTFTDSAGSPVLSPGPRSVFQARVDFLPTVTDGGEVSWIEFAATVPPLAEEVLAEISPAEVELGRVTLFTYALRPTIRAAHSGFDQIELVTPFGMRRVHGVRIGGEAVEPEVGVLDEAATRYRIGLPRKIDRQDSGVVIEIDFEAPVLRYGTTFDSWVRDSERPGELAQRVNPGDAAVEHLSDGLSVRTVLTDALLTGLTVEPRTLTPNGDAINDEVVFAFDVVQLTGDAPLRVEIFGLDGRRVRVLLDGRRPSGHYRLAWDGRDDGQRRVLPGLYIYRLAIEAQQGEDSVTGMVAVAY